MTGFITPLPQGAARPGRASPGGRPTDIRIVAVSTRYTDYVYRTPIKFGGVAVDRVTLLDVECDVLTRRGQAIRGWGSMPLANTWSFPSRDIPATRTILVMRALAERCAKICGEMTAYGHPIELGLELEERFVAAADELGEAFGLPTAIPKLCTLVCGSAFDAALHDAFGRAHGRNCYHTYGQEFLDRDLGSWLGADFTGQWPDAYLRRTPQPRMPLYHLIGALDPLDDGELTQPQGDGLPDTLPQWMRFNGLTHLKIKLNGDDLAWDLERVLKVDRIAAETQRERGVDTLHYSLDFNERCASVEYLLEFLRKLRERSPAGFERVQYIEQPTARDLRQHPQNRMHDAARLKPVVIDESLVDYESLLLARELGYSGAALKACKGQSQTVLMAAAAQKLGMFLCVQDLSCPGASLIHSAGIAAHVPGVAAIEANSRQYCPAANRGWEDRFPGIFRIHDGSMETAVLDGIGLGAMPAQDRNGGTA